jgi:SAM-dependent methyltransferase
MLEIDLGYGTLGQILAGKRSRYFGLDVAASAVSFMRHRLGLAGVGRAAIQVGSALAIPYRDASIDYVYSIGCLHHTGDLPRAIDAVARVLVPGGNAIVMLYHRHSYRQWIERVRLRLRRERRAPEGAAELERHLGGLYDTNADGAAAPFTSYVSRREVGRLFHRFGTVRIDTQNPEGVTLVGGRLRIPRERLLDNVGRVVGLDLYVLATR